MRHLRLLLSFMSVCAVTLVSAASFTIEGFKYTVTSASEQTVSLTGYDKQMDDPVELVIPWRVLNNGIYYRITSIGEEAFADCNTLQSVTIPNSVEMIEDRAFLGCTSLQHVKVQWTTPLVINDNVFDGVDLPAATLYVLQGYKNVYQEADVWKDFGTVNTYVDLDVNMWFKDQHVKEICVSNWDLDGDEELSYREAQAVTDLGAAFTDDAEMTSFTELRSFSGLTSISASAFSGCSNLTEIIIASNVTSIGQEAFVGCERLESVTFQSKLTSIGSSAFAGCTMLGNVTLPANLVFIGDHAFDGCASITSVTIPSKVSSIGEGAFANCSSNTSFTVNSSNKTFVNSTGKTYITNKSDKNILYCYAVGAPQKNINIPSSITAIYPYAFQGAKNIEYLNLNKVFFVGNNAFCDCPNLYTVLVGDTLAGIGSNAFKGVAKGVRVQVPWRIPLSIKAGTFSNYEPVEAGGITGRLFVPAGSKAAYESATGWKWFSFIEEGTIADYAAKIINFADEKTRELCIEAFDTDNDGYLTTDEAATVISIGTIFQGSDIGSFDELKFFTSLAGIDDDAFNGSTLSSIILPESVTTIGDHAFAFCDNLSTITIPKNVEYIGSGPFMACGKLKSITVDAENQFYTSSSGTLFNHDRSTLVQFAANNTLTNISIPKAVSAIASEAFYGASKLVSVNLSTSSISSIGESAFAGCTSLNSVKVGWATPLVVPENVFEGVDLSAATLNVPNGVENLYREAPVWKDFGNYATFKLFVIFADENVERICVSQWDANGDGKLGYDEAAAVTSLDDSFEGNTDITSFGELVEFTALTSIPDNAFKGCSSLALVTLPTNVTDIGSEAFEGCSSLANVTLPATLLTIGDKAFYGCEAFTTCTIPAKVEAVGKGAYGSCTALKSFTVNTKNTHYRAIGNILFTRDSTTVVQFPAAISRTNFEVSSTVFKHIYPYAFSGAVNLKTVVFKSVETIGEYAFEKCEGLTTITIGDKVETIGDCAFLDCQNLQAITLPTNVQSIGEKAFNGMPAGVRCQVSWTTPPAIPANTFSNFEALSDGQVSGLLFVPSGTKDAYKVAEGWDFFDFVHEGNMADYEATLITFADPVVKKLAVGAWDTDGDNQISYDEAAAVTSIGTVFSENAISTFNEFKHFSAVTEVSDNAFKNTGLTAITMPEGITRIGNSAFQGTAISKWNTLPGLKEIGDSAFAYNTGFTALNISANIVKLGIGAFKGCPHLTSIGVQSGNANYSSADGVLYDKSGTTLLQFPAAKTVSGDYAISDNVTAIGEDAFLMVANLQSVFIPGSVTSIGANAFRGCELLDSVTVEWHSPLSVPANTFEGVDVANASLCVPKGSENLYKEAEVWKDFGKLDVYLDDTSIIDFADDKVKSVCVSKWDTSRDGELTVGEAKAVRTLGAYFKGSEITSFNELKYFTGLTSITSNAFNGCKQLEEITLPNTIIEIAYAAFNACSSLKTIEIPASVTVINTNGVFTECSSLEEFKVANGNIRFATVDGVLFDAAKTTLVAYPGGKEGEYTIPANVTTIRQYAFCGASKLTICHLPKTLTAIPVGAFDKCTSLTTVNIPQSVVTIGKLAFRGCESLHAVTVEWRTPLSVLANIFEGVDVSNATLYVPEGTENLYKNADVWKNFGFIESIGPDIESYLVVSEDGKVGTFYHDDLKDERSGMVFDLDDYQGLDADMAFVVTKVMFDPSFGDARPTSTARWFYGMSQIDVIEGMEFLNTSEVTSMEAMFSGCNSLESLDLSYANTSKVVNSEEMFDNCYSLEQLAISSTMGNLSDNTFNGVGTEETPCLIFAPEGFDFGVDTRGVFQWKSGWFTLDEDVPDFVMGDVNYDSNVNVVDVMMVVSYILGETVEGFHIENADMNGDNSVNISDVMSIVDYVLNYVPSSAPALSTSDRVVAFPVAGGVDVRLDNVFRYMALEMTVELPQGAILKRASMAKSGRHLVKTRTLGGGLHRVVVYSLASESFPEGDALLHLDIAGGGDVKISDVLLANTFYEALSPQETTDVVGIASEASEETYYNLQGMKMTQPRKGVYIQNNRKVVVK